MNQLVPIPGESGVLECLIVRKRSSNYAWGLERRRKKVLFSDSS